MNRGEHRSLRATRGEVRGMIVALLGWVKDLTTRQPSLETAITVRIRRPARH
jgi:hypothetical protein